MVETLEAKHRDLLNARSSLQTRIEMKAAEIEKELDALEGLGIDLGELDAEILRLENQVESEEKALMKEFKEIESFFDEVLEVIK